MTDDPFKSVAEGIAKGSVGAILEYGDKKIDKWIKKFRRKKIFFTDDPEIIEIVEEQLKQSEWLFFKRIVKDKKLRSLFRMGLTLRAFERKHKDFNPLAKKILKNHDIKGLHIAQFVQNGLFSIYVGFILEEITEDKLKSEIINLFNDIEKKVTFIRMDDKISGKTKEIIAKIMAHTPDVFIISSSGGAISICEKVKEKVMEEISDNYWCELYDIKGKRIYFLIHLSKFTDT